MKGKLFLIIISFMILSCNSNENRKHENYLKALQNQSTVQNFIVVKVKNLNTNETKEICTKRNFLLGAIHLELNKKYDSISRKEVQIFAESKTDLSFELKNKEALKNISFYNYDASLLNNPKVKAKVKLIEKKIRNSKRLLCHVI